MKPFLYLASPSIPPLIALQRPSSSSQSIAQTPADSRSYNTLNTPKLG